MQDLHWPMGSDWCCDFPTLITKRHNLDVVIPNNIISNITWTIEGLWLKACSNNPLWSRRHRIRWKPGPSNVELVTQKSDKLDLFSNCGSVVICYRLYSNDHDRKLKTRSTVSPWILFHKYMQLVVIPLVDFAITLLSSQKTNYQLLSL